MWPHRVLEGGPSERQHLLGVSREDSEWGRRITKGVVAGGYRNLGISAANVLVFAVHPCTVGT